MNEEAATEAEQALIEWARISGERDQRIFQALAVGVTKHRVHVLTGISRPTIDRLIKETTMTTTPLHGYGSYTSSDAPEEVVRDFCGDFENDFDIDAVAADYRAAINAELDGTGISLHGKEFYSNYPAPDDATETIKAAIEAVDLGEIVSRHDTADS